MRGFIEKPRYLCALGGALATIRALPQKTIPIIHASSGCGGNLSVAINRACGYAGGGYCSGHSMPSTNVIERDIIFGGEDRLREQIKNTLEIMDGDLYIVVTGCMVDMIGDDSESVTGEFSDYKAPVLFAETGGFKGNSYKGYELVLQTIFKNFVEKTNEKEEKTVNLFGIVPFQDIFWEGNLRILKELINKLGYKVNTFFGEGETLEDLKKSSKAILNIVVSNVFGIDAARVFEQEHGIPFITVDLPIGEKGTERFLKTIGKRLSISEKKVQEVIDKEKGYYYKYLSRTADNYDNFDFQRYVVVVGDSNYTQALTRFLADDLGWLPELVMVTDMLDDDEQREVLKGFEDYDSGFKANVIFDTNSSNIPKYLKSIWPDKGEGKYSNSFSPAFVIGGSLEREFAKKIGAQHLSITYPVTDRVIMDRGYAGYKGALRLIEDIFSILVENR